jgi:hypothetical protein
MCPEGERLPEGNSIDFLDRPYLYFKSSSTHDTAQALYLYESVSFIGLGPRGKNFRSDYGLIRYEDMTLSD